MDAQNAALARSRARKTLVKWEPRARGNGIVTAHGEDRFQKLGLLVPQHDAEHVVVHNFLGARGDAPEKLFAVENGSQLAADFVKERQCLGLLRVGDKQALRNRVRITQQSK